MPVATSPKKQSLMASGPLRRSLRAHGHALKMTVQIGKEGLSAPVRKQLAQALADHELVKVKLGSECPEDRFAVAAGIASEPETQIAQILGRTILAYKRRSEDPQFEPADKSSATSSRKPAAGVRKPARRTADGPARRGQKTRNGKAGARSSRPTASGRRGSTTRR